MSYFFQLKQKVGKGDETKDEVFDEFVNNFNRQQVIQLVITFFCTPRGGGILNSYLSVCYPSGFMFFLRICSLNFF